MRHRFSVLFSIVAAAGLLFGVGCDSTGSMSDGERGTLELGMSGTSTRLDRPRSRIARGARVPVRDRRREVGHRSARSGEAGRRVRRQECGLKTLAPPEQRAVARAFPTQMAGFMRRLLLGLFLLAVVLPHSAAGQQWTGTAALTLSGGHQTNTCLDPVLQSWDAPSAGRPHLNPRIFSR